MFGGALGPARTRIVHAFPGAERQRLKGLRERVLIGPAASEQVKASYGTFDHEAARVLEAAFVRSRVIGMQYHKPEGDRILRTVEPHALLLNWPAWYLLTFDRARSDVRTFRLDRIGSVRMEAEEPSAARPRDCPGHRRRRVRRPGSPDPLISPHAPLSWIRTSIIEDFGWDAA